MDLKTLIQASLDTIALERELNKQKKIAESGSGYNVQYCPCGHSREIKRSELALLAKAREHAKTYYDAFILPSSYCPECQLLS